MIPSGPKIPEFDIDAHLDRLREGYPDLHDRIDVERAHAWYREFRHSGLAVDDFGTEQRGGRGESYLRAQATNLHARAHGMRRLLDLIPACADTGRKTVVDVLGGDGLVQRVATAIGLTEVEVLTCDLSPYMVDAAWSLGYPALLQRADRLLQRDGSVDGVLVAYGSHHIKPDERVDVACEAYRVLRPGGVFVLHDFAELSPMHEWFERVVDRHSQTGHRYDHFTREEMQGYLSKAGFESYEVLEIADPYRAVGPTAEAAELELGRYLLDMYGLVGITRTWGAEADRWVIDRAKEIFRYPQEDGSMEEFSLVHDAESGTWRATLPRMAIVGVGRKM